MTEPTFRERAFSRARMLDAERPGTHLPPLVRVVQTCMALPSQWDAWDAAGQYYYLRFRCGRGTVELAKSAEDYVRNGDPYAEPAANFNHGDEWAGEISLMMFLELAGMRLADDASVR